MTNDNKESDHETGIGQRGARDWRLIRLEALSALYRIDSTMPHLGSFKQSEALGYAVALEEAAAALREKLTACTSLVNERRESSADHSAALVPEPRETDRVFGYECVEDPRTGEPLWRKPIPSVESAKNRVWEAMAAWGVVDPDNSKKEEASLAEAQSALDDLILAVQQQSAQEIERLRKELSALRSQRS